MSGQDLEKRENNEQFGKDIVVGRKESYYEDGKNFVSVIINAISVRINMPRGTVKALMACFIALLLAAGFYGLSLLHSNDADTAVAETETEAEEASETEAVAEDPEGVISLKDYVNISPHFYYHLPDNVEDVWDPDEYYAENETFCDFTYNDEFYTIRSYVLDYKDKDLADTVKADLSLFDSMTFIDEEYIDGKYGEILKIRFESTDEQGLPVVGTGYYWYESSPQICCLEVSSDAWHDDGAEEMVKDSIYRVSSGTTAPYAVDEEAWEEQQKEEAANSMGEDAMREYYEPDHDPNDDRVLKP